MSVNLSKGHKISLKKEAGEQLSNIIMGLGWDQKKKEKAKGWKGFFKSSGSSSGSIDLDASCILLDENKQLVDSVWFQQLRSKDGSIQHTGDNLTGAGEGDDEQIKINLNNVPPQVKYLVFTINSYTSQSFAEVENAFCRIVNQRNNKEIARYNLSGGGDYTAQIMAKLYRYEGEWKMHAIGEGTQGKTYKDMLPFIQSII